MWQTTARIGPWLYPGAVFQKDDRGVYLTYDDGPHQGCTTELISLLAENDLSASFFCLGEQAKKHPELIEEIRRAPHIALGAHGMQHRSSILPNSWMERQAVESCELLGTELYRPPYARMPLGLPARLKKHGIQTILLDIMAYDFSPDVDADQMLAICRKRLKPGSIIVLHDQPGLNRKHESFLPQFKQILDEKGLKSRML